jgi:hypothetical protein
MPVSFSIFEASSLPLEAFLKALVAVANTWFTPMPEIFRLNP